MGTSATGVFHVVFRDAERLLTESVIVLQDGVIDGADEVHFFRGSYRIEGQRLSGRLRVDRWNPKEHCVLGDATEMEFEFAGTATPGFNGFEATGTAQALPGVRINATGTLLTEADGVGEPG